jgi:holo-[acyl-carrier protein] synthase
MAAQRLSWPAKRDPSQQPALCVGCDAVEVSRVRAQVVRYGQAAYRACLLGDEWAYVWASPRLNVIAQRLAVRLAAKEAVAKALGVGLNGMGFSQGIRWMDVAIERCPEAPQPQCRLGGQAAVLAQAQGWTGVSLSLTHTAELGLATVVLW